MPFDYLAQEIEFDGPIGEEDDVAGYEGNDPFDASTKECVCLSDGESHNDEFDEDVSFVHHSLGVVHVVLYDVSEDKLFFI